MTMTDPITPPPELIEQWMQAHSTKYDLARQAAQWGADQELEACCAWLPKMPPWSANDLRKHRRPKPPSLKAQALGALGRFHTNTHTRADEMTQDFDLIRRALEALDD
jgi:hypothetical protein